MKIIFKKTFQKQLKRGGIVLKNKFLIALDIFLQDEFDTRLHNHQLRGKLSSYRSINITGDIRALYYKEKDGNIVIFCMIGTHSQLYG